MFHNNNGKISETEESKKKKIKGKLYINVIAFYAAIKIQMRKNCKIK